MALVGKRDDLIHVPWFSVEEWLDVYKNIYSGDSSRQKEAYEMLLVWKTRMSNLPVGVECTLGLLQASLRDQEWTPQIYSGQKPLTYEKDLQSIYSMGIMKFLNHISNIAHNKQTSLFEIAKNLNIPEWIVNLRHDTAHGSELPSIDVMRIVSSKLLAWVHEEYWAAEAGNLQISHGLNGIEKIISEEEEDLNKLFELWVAINLYIKTDHEIVSDLPDIRIKDALHLICKKLNLSNTALNSGITFAVDDDLDLPTVSNCLFDGISKILSKNSSFSTTGKVIIDLILNSEAFLATPEILNIFDATPETINQNHLPVTLIEFWKDILRLLQDKKILISLCIQMIEFVNKENDEHKILLASLWVKTLVRSFLKLNISKQIYQSLEQKFNHNKVEVISKNLVKLVQEEIDLSYPDLKEIPDLNVFSDFPNCFNDSSFVKQLINNSKVVAENYILEIVELSAVFKDDPNKKAKLLNLLEINSQTDINTAIEIDSSENIHSKSEEVFLLEDIEKNFSIEKLKSLEKNEDKIETFADIKVRNTKWEIANNAENHDWNNCPIGVLPWQMNTLQTLSSLIVSPSKVRHAVARNVNIPRILDSNGIRLHSKIQWEELEEEKRKRKKRQSMLKQKNK